MASWGCLGITWAGLGRVWGRLGAILEGILRQDDFGLDRFVGGFRARLGWPQNRPISTTIFKNETRALQDRLWVDLGLFGAGSKKAFRVGKCDTGAEAVFSTKICVRKSLSAEVGST